VSGGRTPEGVDDNAKKARHGGVDYVCRMHHSDGMSKDVAVTVRIPSGLKRRLEAVARKERRSLSAQITSVLEREARDEAVEAEPGAKLLGRYEGTPVPSDEDLIEVRRLLWGALGRRSGRAA
jgi:predicted transcriptional regulator